MHRHGAALAVGFSCLGHAVMHILAALYLTIVLGLQHAWAMSYDDLLRLWTIGSLLIGVGAPLAGWLGDRWSESRMRAVFFLLSGAGAVAAGLVETPAALTAALAVLGLGASIYHPVGMSWLVRHATNRGRAMGLLGIFGSLGIGLAALIAGSLTDALSWRAAFLVPGAVSVVIGLALVACIALGWVTDRKDDARPQAEPSRGDAVRVFIVLSVTMVCGGLIFNSLQVALPKWFELGLGGLTGGDLAVVGGLVTTVYLFASLSQFVGGHLCDRHPLKRVYVGGMMLQLPLLALVGSLAEAPLFVVAAACVFMGSFLLPAENLLLAQYTPNRHRGLAYGLKFILSLGVAPIAVQLVAGTFEATGGFALLAGVLAGLSATALLAALTLPAARHTPPAVATAAAPDAPDLVAGAARRAA